MNQMILDEAVRDGEGKSIQRMCSSAVFGDEEVTWSPVIRSLALCYVCVCNHSSYTRCPLWILRPTETLKIWV